MVTTVTLNEKLMAIRRERLHGEAAAAYQEVMERFDTSVMLDNALQPGDTAPEFQLPNTSGRLVSSADLLQRGPLIVTFYRGSWCPYCMTALEALEKLRPDFQRHGADIVALAPETGGRASEVKQRYDLQFDVLTDIDNVVALQFGVMVRLPERYRRLLSSKGIDPQAWHGNPGWFVPLASSFVIAPDGIVSHTEVHVDFTVRTEPDSLQRALRGLRDDEAGSR